jgi:hypothetical protein
MVLGWGRVMDVQLDWVPSFIRLGDAVIQRDGAGKRGEDKFRKMVYTCLK